VFDFFNTNRDFLTKTSRAWYKCLLWLTDGSDGSDGSDVADVADGAIAIAALLLLRRRMTSAERRCCTWLAEPGKSEAVLKRCRKCATEVVRTAFRADDARQTTSEVEDSLSLNPEVTRELTSLIVTSSREQTL